MRGKTYTSVQSEIYNNHERCNEMYAHLLYVIQILGLKVPCSRMTPRHVDVLSITFMARKHEHPHSRVECPKLHQQQNSYDDWMSKDLEENPLIIVVQAHL